ncbi:pectin lyase-like protein [Phellopilus nigrolimitatus]|nr:pectin lyase-like protein [Phellopilus nigrolimitatus]
MIKIFLLYLLSVPFIRLIGVAASTCTVSPLGLGKDDTDQVLRAIEKCGKNGRTDLQAGTYNITRKMTWNLENSQVDLHGVLNFVPDIEYWLNSNNTYRVVFIQDQASWFVVTGKDFLIDAHNEGGIEGNGQPWWEYFQNHTREDGDGRPLSLTLHEVERGVVRDFRIQSPPFWCNAVANSQDVTYDGMTCNATNTNPEFYGQNIVPNTDGIDTYRSNNVTLKNWDVTCGDDCLAIKGNSTNLLVQNITCHGGNGVAFGSLGQYVQFNDIVQNVLMEDLNIIRINSSIQPNMLYGTYFKSWTGSVNGVPPTGGGGGGGFVKNVVARRVSLSDVDTPMGLYQTNDGHSGDTPSFLQFGDLSFQNWSGNATTNTLVNMNCSTNAPCSNITFLNFDVAPPSGEPPQFICIDVESEFGLSAPCNITES